MITEIQGDTNTFRAIAYGRPDTLTMEWCNQREQAHLAGLCSEVRNNYMAMQNTVHGAIDYAQIAAIADSLRVQTDASWMVNDIIRLETIQQFQQPPPIMVDWLMANPYVRSRYYKQTIAGYDEYYVDHDPGDIGENHYHYRRVMNGIFQENEEGALLAHEWFEDIRQPTDELTFTQQMIVVNVWDKLTGFLLEGGKDPTSRYGAAL